MQFLDVILPGIIQINARRRVSLVKTIAKRALFPVGNMTSLINFKKAEHRNNKLFVLFSLLSSLFASLKRKFTPSPRKKRGKTKTGYKIYIDAYKKKLKSCALKYRCTRGKQPFGKSLLCCTRPNSFKEN